MPDMTNIMMDQSMGTPPMGPAMAPPQPEMPMAPPMLPNAPVVGSLDSDGEKSIQTEQEYNKEVQYVLPQEEKDKIAQYIINLVDDCETRREGWKEIRKECMDLLYGIRAPKSDPWPNCSNITTMASATHCRLIHAKLMPAVWNENLVYWKPIEKADVDNVEKIGTFMRWVVKYDIKIQDKVDDSLWDLITNGTLASKVRWDIEYRTIMEKDENGKIKYKKVAHPRAFVDNIPIDDVYLPDLWEDEDSAEFIAQNIYTRIGDINSLVKRGIYQVDDIDAKLKPKLDEQVADSLGKKKDEVIGTTGFTSRVAGMPIRLIECYMSWEINGEMTESVFTVGYESGAYLSGKPLAAVSAIGKRPWIISPFIRIGGKPYGLSLIEIMRGLAKELDAIHNQRIDAGSVTIAPFGFYRPASSYSPDKVQIGPGVMIPVDDPQRDVNIITLQHNPIASFQEERIIIEYIEKLTSTSAYQMGRESDIVKSRATATGTMAIIGQGEQAFSVLAARCQCIFSRILTKVLQNYQMYMPEGYADRIIGEKPGDVLFPTGLGKADIAGQCDAFMALDSTAGNKMMERQTNAAIIQMGPQLLAMAQDPRGYEMARDFLISAGKIDVERYIGPKPQAKPTPTSMGQGFAGVPNGPGLDVQPGGAGA